MKRHVGRRIYAGILGLILLGVLLAVLVVDPIGDSGDQVTDSATIQSYDVEMDLARDGTLVTTEKLLVYLPGGKHGIFRIFDTGDHRREGVTHPVDEVSVTRDGEYELAVFTDSKRGNETLRIGRPEVTLDPGLHTYVIRSTTTDVFEPGLKEGQTLWWWDVIGGGWQMPIAEAHVKVALPATPLKAQCVQAENDPCTAAVADRTLTVDTGPLAPFEPVTVRVAFDARSVATPIEGDQTTRVILGVLGGVVAAALALAFFVLTRERKPGFPVLFEPPAGIYPALGARVLEEEHSDDDLQATLFALGERGVVKLEGNDERWTVDLLVDALTAGLHQTEVDVLGRLGLVTAGSSFTVSKTKTSGEKIARAKETLRSGVVRDATPFLKASGIGMLGNAVAVLCAIGLLVIAGFYHFGNWDPPLWLVTFVGTFAVLALPIAVMPGVGTKRTEQGREVWSRTGGFARFLTTDSSESRFDAAAHLDWYPRYLAWAVAFGVGDAWAQRFAAQGVEIPEVPYLYWYGTGHFTASRMSDSFNSTISGATAAYAASQSSSSSGGGGGFSGGSGGGGGGGGSW